MFNNATKKKQVLEGNKPNNSVAACHEKVLLLLVRFGTAVVNGLEDSSVMELGM